MSQTFVCVNGKSIGFTDLKEAFSYFMSLAIRHAECMDLSAIQENICTACDLVSEMLLIKADELDTLQKATKTSYRRLSTRMINSKSYLNSIHDRNQLLLAWGDLMLAVEGKALLIGFGFGSQKYVGLEPGNAEKVSVTKNRS